MAITWLTNVGTEGPAEPTVIAYSETDSYDESTWSGSVELECPWEDRYLVSGNILDYGILWPYNPDALMPVVGASIKAAPNSRTSLVDGVQCYEKARIVLKFSRNGPEIFEQGGTEDDGGPPIRYTEEIDVSGEMLRLPPDNFYWEGTGTEGPFVNVKTDEAPNMPLFGLDYIVKWTKVRSLPITLLTTLNHVNSATIVSNSLGLTFEPQTLLFNPPKISRSVTLISSLDLYDLECRWSYRAQGWNRFYRAQTQAFEQMFIDLPGDAGITEFEPFIPVSFADMLPNAYESS